MTLEKETRDAIGRTVRALRGLFEDEFGKQASGRFGIRSVRRDSTSGDDGLDAYLDPIETLSLTPAEFAQRDELIHALRYLVSEDYEPYEAVARLIREAAFTAVNRLLAVRVAEAIGVLPPVLSGGRQSAGYRDTVGDLFPGLAHDPDSYWIYVQVAGDELAPGVPRLFDRRHPTSAFVPSRALVDQALDHLTTDELADAWGEPETLGWGYQFFNGDDVKQMRDESSSPRNSRELAVRNQFFTPRYVVDWLVQNTLGRRLAQAGYELDLPLLVGEVGNHEPLALEEVRVLDPAVGSGHFLLGSYDLLEQAWQSTGIPPDQAASRILPCLFGVEIDPRAAQVAQAVLLLRARRSAPSTELAPPTIVTAVALPHGKELREQAFGDLSPAARHLADRITDALDQAPVLGSLLKVEKRLAEELASHKAAPRLAVDGSETHVLHELNRALDDLVSAAATPEQRMFTAEAADALRFLDICRQRYDAILMNPPFGEGVPGKARAALKNLFPDWWTELYACFLTRSFELLEHRGVVGMLSSSQYFITRKMRELRQLIAEEWPPLAVIDLGPGVLAGATVNTAVSVFSREDGSRATAYLDLTHLEDESRATAVTKAKPSDYRDVYVESFLALDRTPFAFHVPERILQLWMSPDRLDPDVVDIRTGNNTFDNFRFLRLAWEVSPRNDGWMRYQKGGEYKPYLEPSHLVIDWRDDGREMKEHAIEVVGGTAQVMQSSTYWMRPGLTAPRVSSVGFGARFLPEGEIFGEKAISFFPVYDVDMSALLGLTNSTVFAEVVRVFGRSRATENGALKAMPIGPRLVEQAAERGITDPVREISEILWRWETREETSPLFISPAANDGPTSSTEAVSRLERDQAELRQLQAHVDDIAAAVLGIDASRIIDAEVTRRPDLVPTVLGSRRGMAAKWAGDVVSWAVGVVFGRWSSDLSTSNDRQTSHQWLARLPTVPPAMTASGESLRVIDGAGPGSLGAQVSALLDDLGSDLSSDIRSSLKTPSIGDWIENKFFAVHFGKYSKSRRYAPIYWQLAVPSKRWGLWLYAPMLSRESIFAVARASQDKLASLKDQIRLARERAETDRNARERAEGLEDLAAEVEKFAAVAEEVAQSGWEPDLNDGFVLNAAPLEELFVDKKWLSQIAKHRKAMQKGEYPWATVQRNYFEKRT